MGRLKSNKRQAGATGRCLLQSDVPTGWGNRGECCRISGLTWTPWVFHLWSENNWGRSSNCSLIMLSLSQCSAPTWHSDIHCLHIQVALKEGQDLNPSPEYAWTWYIVTDMFIETEDLTKAVVLVPGEVVLFFGRQSQGEGLSYEEVGEAAFQL